MIDLITGHQGVAHISVEQIANINNALMDDYGVDKVVRLDDGTLTQDGLTINVGTGFWRVNGFDMEIQEAETVYIDPTATGLSRIDNIYVEILQDIPTGSQRSEIVTVQGEAAASPVAPDAPTAPVLNTDILLQVTPLATVTVTEGAMVMTDLSVAYEMVTPSEFEAVETAVTDIVNVYGAKNLIPYDYLTSSQVVNGITVTPLKDGTYKLNGTAPSFTDIRLSPFGTSSYDACLTLEKGTYILSGTPISSVSGGTGKANVGLIINDGTNRSNLGWDFGDGYTLVHSDTSIRYEVKISIPQNITLSDVVFKPMLRLASIQDDTYVPYAKTNKELTDTFTDQVANKDDEYSSSKAYKVGEHCIYNNVLYKCVTACSAAAWDVNQNCFEEATLTSAVTDLNNDLSNCSIRSVRYQIANNTSQQQFSYPSGFSSYILIGAKCETKYNSVVDSSYGDKIYFGEVMYQSDHFKFTPKVAGNTLYIEFFFLCR